jgi:hypothetical protein
MKTAALLLITLTAFVSAQEKTSQHHRTFPPMTNEPVDMQIGVDSVYVTGHWIALDERSTLSGPSVSEISCEKATNVCHESQANIAVIDNMFSLTGDSVDYAVTRWNSNEIVAQNISGVCRVLHTPKFDLKNKKVYALDSLSEPVENLPKMSKDACNAVGLRLELRANTTYSTEAR